MIHEPNARVMAYERLLGDTLKVTWHARRDPDKVWIEFHPADLKVELNGVELTTCSGVSVDFSRDSGAPRARLDFTLEKLDIDAETLIALQAFVKQNEEDA